MGVDNMYNYDSPRLIRSLMNLTQMKTFLQSVCPEATIEVDELHQRLIVSREDLLREGEYFVYRNGRVTLKEFEVSEQRGEKMEIRTNWELIEDI